MSKITSIHLYKKEHHGFGKWFRACDAGTLIELLTLYSTHLSNNGIFFTTFFFGLQLQKKKNFHQFRWSGVKHNATGHFQWSEILMLQHSKTFWTMLCFWLFGNSCGRPMVGWIWCGRTWQSPDLNPTEPLWDELEQRLKARTSHPASVPDLTNALLDEWTKIPQKHTFYVFTVKVPVGTKQKQNFKV